MGGGNRGFEVVLHGWRKDGLQGDRSPGQSYEEPDWRYTDSVAIQYFEGHDEIWTLTPPSQGWEEESREDQRPPGNIPI